MPVAGQRLVAGRIPGERIETVKITSNSAETSGAEIQIASITAFLRSGCIYKIVLDTAVTGDASGGTDQRGQFSIYEDTPSGNMLARGVAPILAASINGYRVHIETEYTAVADGDKTFVVTLDVFGGGTASMAASQTAPTFLYIDYIRG